eukprot:COSAG06_NODE_4011_length_4663_cov_7.007230_1_plen_142_part_00
MPQTIALLAGLSRSAWVGLSDLGTRRIATAVVLREFRNGKISANCCLSQSDMFHHGMEEHIGSVVPVFDQRISGEALCVDINPSKPRFGSQVCTPDRSRSRARFSMRIPPTPVDAASSALSAQMAVSDDAGQLLRGADYPR